MQASNLEENYNIRIEIIRLTAPDGVKVKAYFIAQPDKWNADSATTSLIVLNHGQNGNPWNEMGVAYALAQRGFAVLLPEYRGHGTNNAPATYGNKEPWDVLGFLDLLEGDSQFDFINISNSGIHGGSMGGYMSTSAFIYETAGKGRFKALSEIAGPLNLSRGIDFQSPDGFAFLGTIPFNQNLTGKDPIKYIAKNPALYKNILIQHGDQDETVDYRCAVDFYRVLDPTQTRDDVIFTIFVGMGHGITKNIDALTNMTIWMEYHLRGNVYTAAEIEFEMLNFGFLRDPVQKFYESLQYALLFGGVAVVFLFIILRRNKIQIGRVHCHIVNTLLIKMTNS